MNILHLLSQNHLTGAEVYAATLIKSQLESGHRVYQISNGFFFETQSIKLQKEVETKSKLEFIKNIFWLRNYLKKENIHVVHTHSRAAVKLAYWATLFTRTASVATVHGIQHSSFSKKIHNQYGQFIIAVCKNIQDHLINDFSYSKRRIKIIANPIPEKDFNFVEKKTDTLKSVKKIAIVGRTTGPKAKRTEQVIESLINLPHEVFLIGGTAKNLNLPTHLKNRIQEINEKKLTSHDYQQFDLVIGSGRVCMESIISGTPTIAFGEAKYLGPIDTHNFYHAAESNFGDIWKNKLEPEINSHSFLADLNYTFNNSAELAEMAKKLFSESQICKKVQRIYESAFFLKNYDRWIPVLMYHKIPNNEIRSQHKIFVTKNNFEKHLKFLKFFKFSTLTFSDLAKYRTAQLDFNFFPKKPIILTFDDGYIDNIENASPLLKKYNYSAQVFLLADNNINKNSWDISPNEPSHEIVSGPARQAWRGSAFEIGSHGFSHKKITELNDQEALAELRQSKETLENEFSTKVNSFAFTYGLVDEKSKELAQYAGYDYALNTDSGGLLLEEDPYAIFRVNIFPNENYWSLFKKTSRWYRRYYFFKRNR